METFPKMIVIKRMSRECSSTLNEDGTFKETSTGRLLFEWPQAKAVAQWLNDMEKETTVYYKAVAVY